MRSFASMLTVGSRTKTMAENLKMSPALLSRFDLVFVLIDDPDARRDQMLSEHVFSVRSVP